MAGKLQLASSGNVPSQEGEFFKVITPAMVYRFLREGAETIGYGPESVTQIELPRSVKTSGEMWHPNSEGYFIQTHRTDTEETVDSGIVIDKKASPDVYVVTAFSQFGEYTKHPFISQGRPGARTIENEIMGVVLEATLEDILDFGKSWTPKQKETILKMAVNEHYQDLFPVEKRKTFPLKN